MLGLERFDIGNAMVFFPQGLTRIIRLAYFKARTTFRRCAGRTNRWRETSVAAGEDQTYSTGVLNIAPEGAGIVEAALAACRDTGLAHETLDRGEIERRHPAFTLPAGIRAVPAR